MIQKVAKNLKEQIGMLSRLWYLEWEDMQVERENAEVSQKSYEHEGQDVKKWDQSNTLGLEGNAIPFSETSCLALECLWNKGLMSCHVVTFKNFIASSNLDFQNLWTLYFCSHCQPKEHS